ncbi:hypothetical protein Tco_1013254 [Tanacetum coccineum]
MNSNMNSNGQYMNNDLTLSAPSPTIYMQQFWYTIYIVPEEKGVIRFKIDQQKVDFSLETFRTALRLPNQTSAKPFDQPFEFLTIALFLKSLSYVGQLDYITQFLVKNLPQPWQMLFKVLNSYTTTKMNAYD